MASISHFQLTLCGRRHVSPGKTCFNIVAKIRKVKKLEYPWGKDPDPNVKGGVLSHLSTFKPLKEKPKPVALEFEKPLMDMQNKIMDVQKMADETGLDYSDEIISLENKYKEALKDLYTHLTPIQRISIARHPNRPTFLDHVFNITDKFVELHGDRAGYDDPAIVTGIGTIDGRRFMFMGHQKGRNTKENIQRNFAMPTPHGHRKTLRMMHYADHHGFPIVIFIDTPGAFADLKSEELGQGESIGQNLWTMYGLKVPIVSIVSGEGGSGGALAFVSANKLLMLENAVFYVASPEACAAILWKTASASPKAAEKLKITANDLCRLQIADGIIPEPLGGAHADPQWTSAQIKKAILESMDELEKMGTEELLKHRMHKVRKIGMFQEGLPVDPEKKLNMKRKENNNIRDNTSSDPKPRLLKEVTKAKIFNEDYKKTHPLKAKVNDKFKEALEKSTLKQNIENLKDEIKESGVCDIEEFDQELREKVLEVKEQVEYELVNTLESLGVHVVSKVGQTSMLKIKTKVDELNAEVNQIIQDVIESSPGLKNKIEILKLEVVKDKHTPSNESKEKIVSLQQQIKQGVTDAMSCAVIKDKYEQLQAELAQLPVGFDGI